MKNANLSNLDICKLQSAAFESRTANARLERERLENLKVIEKLTSERDDALAQNSELVAQVEVLRNLFPLKSPVSCEGFLNYPLRKYNEVVDAFNSAPQQHLCDIQAEAGRAGFVAGVQYAHKRPDTILPKVIEMVACDYAERVKAGEV